MNSLYEFIVQPIGKTYNNTTKVGDKDLILNNKIESWKFVNRTAKVISIPSGIETNIKTGDTIIVHQNVFRKFYDMQGNKKNSRSYFKDNLYFVSLDQVYLYKTLDKWNTFGDRCFVKPIKNTDVLSSDKTAPYVGILKYTNSSLERSKIALNDVVGFKPGAEWEFVVDNELLYCMKSNDIVIKYGNKKNQEEYNPSWAHSC
tara:strand:+ start:9337 stop:9942 length:606 start_codon:yes stop_codon:yes gene_type:complete